MNRYFGHYFGDRVKILRTAKREGLIRARIAGAKTAQGDVLVFLDSHCEVTDGWLEPLLAKIAEDRTVITTSIIALLLSSLFILIDCSLVCSLFFAQLLVHFLFAQNVVCPVIDVIGDKNLDYSVGNPYYFQVGGFTWSGNES